jgi:hypothetical protein
MCRDDHKERFRIPITDCTLKGKSSGQADVYALDICEKFSLRIDETAHKRVLSFEMATRHILLPTFSITAMVFIRNGFPSTRAASIHFFGFLISRARYAFNHCRFI